MLKLCFYLRSVFNGCSTNTNHYYYYLRSLWAFWIYVQITILQFYNYFFYENIKMKMKIVVCVSLESSCNAQQIQRICDRMCCTCTNFFYLNSILLLSKPILFSFFLRKNVLKKTTSNCANQKNSLNLLILFIKQKILNSGFHGVWNETAKLGFEVYGSCDWLKFTRRICENRSDDVSS